MSDTLVGFLIARLDEDEEVARGDEAPQFSTPYLARIDYGEISIGTNRVLADVDAKRRMLQHYNEVNGRSGDDEHDEYTELIYREHILKFLALPYADHPDYRPEWKP